MKGAASSPRLLDTKYLLVFTFAEVFQHTTYTESGLGPRWMLDKNRQLENKLQDNHVSIFSVKNLGMWAGTVSVPLRLLG